MRDVVQDLLHMLEDSVSQAGEVTTMIDKISKSISRVIYVDLDRHFNVDLVINFNVDLDMNFNVDLVIISMLTLT